MKRKRMSDIWVQVGPLSFVDAKLLSKYRYRFSQHLTRDGYDDSKLIEYNSCINRECEGIDFQNWVLNKSNYKR